ncbi:MAG: ribose 5-phosphate isomerase B [Chloroherpetonaceae bacterium]|nr:ribose 5-phosphate isomerase B [Chloroherpetonaceae bacterium]
MGKTLITEKDILAAKRSGKSEIELTSVSLVTPLAKDRAKEFGIKLISKLKATKPLPEPSQLTIAIGSDHSGFQTKTDLKKLLADKNYRLLDFGTDSESSCDYPDFAEKVGEAVRTGRATFGIMIDGVGTASAIVLNKMPGIRAALCYNEFSAQIARGHGNANVLTLGARALGIEVIKRIVTTFITTPFEGERHQTRLSKVEAIEKKFLKTY